MAASHQMLVAACAAVLLAAMAPHAEAIVVAQAGAVGQKDSSLQEDRDRRSKLLERTAALGVVCEEMCKDLGDYPNCQCDLTDGERACADQYCPGSSDPCTNSAFQTCVEQTTSNSLLQWDSLLQRFDGSLTAYSRMIQAVEAKKVHHAAESCSEKDHSQRALIQAKMAVFDVKCEEMCKKIGVYPNCQCPGFEGNPSSDDDTRKCMEQYCQDPSTPCPTESFVTCVKEATKVSALQWDSLLQRLSTSMDLFKNTWSAARKASSSPA